MEQQRQQRLLKERELQASELRDELARQRLLYEQQLDERDMEQVSRERELEQEAARAVMRHQKEQKLLLIERDQVASNVRANSA